MLIQLWASDKYTLKKKTKTIDEVEKKKKKKQKKGGYLIQNTRTHSIRNKNWVFGYLVKLPDFAFLWKD
jgi:hypothetical protein